MHKCQVGERSCLHPQKTSSPDSSDLLSTSWILSLCLLFLCCSSLFLVWWLTAVSQNGLGSPWGGARQNSSSLYWVLLVVHPRTHFLLPSLSALCSLAAPSPYPSNDFWENSRGHFCAISPLTLLNFAFSIYHPSFGTAHQLTGRKSENDPCF